MVMTKTEVRKRIKSLESQNNKLVLKRALGKITKKEYSKKVKTIQDKLLLLYKKT